MEYEHNHCSVEGQVEREQAHLRAILSWLRGEIKRKSDAASSVGVTQARLDQRLAKICRKMRSSGFSTPDVNVSYLRDKQGYQKVLLEYAKLRGYVL